MKKLIFTVTNDLNYDQRMSRICTTLANAGYGVLLIGRKERNSRPLMQKPYDQKRLHCFFKKGKAFYFEYNIRLFVYLLIKKCNVICAIDLDTILPCYFICRIRNKIKVYDAHELFSEMKEVVTRPRIYRFWKKIEKFTVPNFKIGYTVSSYIQNYFKKNYGVNYEVVRNMPCLEELKLPVEHEPYILYQGAVNQGRCFENLIPAFQWIKVPLWIYGDGNFYEEAMELVKKYHLENKILFKGKLLPHELKKITYGALLGITLFEKDSLSNYYSLANRFFDYIHAGVPQVCVNYPAYQQINQQFEVALLLDDLTPKSIASQINALIDDASKMDNLRRNCNKAREAFNWQKEEKILLEFYKTLTADK